MIRLADMWRRVRTQIVRAAVTLVADGDLASQRLQVRTVGGAILDDVEHALPFGFASSVPVDEAEVLLLSILGARHHRLALNARSRKWRWLDLPTGDCVIYNQNGEYIHLKNADGEIAVTARTAVAVTAPTVTIAAETKVTIDSPLVELSGGLTVAGDVDVTGLVSASEVEVDGIAMSDHKHSGVSAGGGTSGPPV